MSIILPAGQTTVTIEKDKDARIYSSFDLIELIPPDDTLANVSWESGVGIVVDETSFSTNEVGAWFSGGTQNKWFSAVATWISSSGASDQFVVQVFIKEDAETVSDMGSALFPNKLTAVNDLRRDRLVLAAQTHFGGIELSSSYIWSKLIVAEAEVSRLLRVKLTPTAFFPLPPTQEQIDALDGMPWEEDPAYDYDPDMFQGEMWGFVMTNNKPLISVQSLRYIYPDPGLLSYEIPADWLRLDKKAGQVRIVPASVASLPISAFLMQVIGAGRVVPHMMHLTYVAGLANAARDFPDLVDVVKKVAVLKMIEDSFNGQSGSISADGLSQSTSIDTSKYEDSIDRILNGPKGSNGGLMAAIHGIRLGVM